MEQHELGRTGRKVSVVGLGTWQLGADWGDVSESDARAVLETAAEEGVTFYDTADVYGDGRSEQIVGRFLADHADAGFTVATKMGRREEQLPENYNPANFRVLDRPVAQQPRCRPARPRPAALPSVGHDRRRRDVRRTRRTGRGRLHRGVRRQRRDRRPGPQRDDPSAPRDRADHPQRAAAQAAREGAADRDRDRCRGHRAGAAGFGAAVGEVRREHHLRRGRPPQATTATAAPSTWGRPSPGCPTTSGCRRPLSSPRWSATSPGGLTPAQAAIAWAWQLPGVSTVIPGARNPEQARSNAAAGRSLDLGTEFLAGVGRIYDERVRELVHDRW